MAAAAPVRSLRLGHQGNRCPICQDRLRPHWRLEDQQRQSCCGVLMCIPCWKDWEEERLNVMNEFVEVCGQRALDVFFTRQSKKLRVRARGGKEKQEEQSKTNAAGKKAKEEKKKRALEKSLERHCSCPSCRAPMPFNAEDQVIQLRRKADQGHSWAQCELGMKYRDGLGVRKDARQAERWFRAAMTDMSVMDGGPLGAFNLGCLYAKGSHGVRKDVEEAKKLWTMAHEAGHIYATSNLGTLFRGDYGPAAGVPDQEKKITLYRQAAEAGHYPAQFNLGNACRRGTGLEQDKEKAKAWYAKAVKQGHALAMYSLAGVLEETEGAATMPARMALLRAAAKKGHAQAKEYTPKLEEWILSVCASCGKPRAAMAEDPKRCNRCFAAAYCSAACQKQHWKRGGHKEACNGRMKYLPSEEEEEEEE